MRAEHIEEVIATQAKRRYEIVDDDIRAIYGHTLDAAISFATSSVRQLRKSYWRSQPRQAKEPFANILRYKYYLSS
jgi:RNA:NAD 2'-phosphotransferase (TPT1/KptA family)